MNEPRTFVVNGQKGQQTGLDVAKQYIKAKVVQRVRPSLTVPHIAHADRPLQIMRDLKTTPFAVICYGHEKTKNILTMRAKQAAMDNDEKFDRKNDSYRHCYDFLPLTFTFDKTLLERINEMEAGYPGSPPADCASSLLAHFRDLSLTSLNHCSILVYSALGSHPRHRNDRRSQQPRKIPRKEHRSHHRRRVRSRLGRVEECPEAAEHQEYERDSRVRSLAPPPRSSFSEADAPLRSGMDFDDEEIGYIQEDKSKFKVRLPLPLYLI
jgi:hypothetical protein